MSHLLIADDDPTIPRLLDMVFSRMGHRVSVASTVEETQHLLTQGDPVDLLILDYYLHDTDAVALLNNLAGDPAFVGVPILMSSAELSDDTQSREMLLRRFPERLRGMVKGWVRKPYAIDVLDAEVKRVLKDTYPV